MLPNKRVPVATKIKVVTDRLGQYEAAIQGLPFESECDGCFYFAKYRRFDSACKNCPFAFNVITRDSSESQRGFQCNSDSAREARGTMDKISSYVYGDENLRYLSPYLTKLIRKSVNKKHRANMVKHYKMLRKITKVWMRKNFPSYSFKLARLTEADYQKFIDTPIRIK